MVHGEKDVFRPSDSTFKHTAWKNESQDKEIPGLQHAVHKSRLKKEQRFLQPPGQDEWAMTNPASTELSTTEAPIHVGLDDGSQVQESASRSAVYHYAVVAIVTTVAGVVFIVLVGFFSGRKSIRALQNTSLNNTERPFLNL
ncbi:uncharacterized protein LOC144105523 [Amblyomma americanum]